MIVVFMGVSGSGKTTVGRRFAEKKGWAFFDADDYHPLTNIDKMRRGVSLNDEDRWPWLDRLHSLIKGWIADEKNTVLACSALKQAYRDRLSVGSAVAWVYLKADRALIQRRLSERTGHFASPALLDDQFLSLEEPVGAIVLDASRPVDDLVAELTA